MAKEYKEPHFDKAGAKAIMKALAQDNKNTVKGGKKKADTKKK